MLFACRNFLLKIAYVCSRGDDLRPPLVLDDFRLTDVTSCDLSFGTTEEDA